MTKLTNEDNVQAEMANHDKHYWALVQGLKRKRKGWGELATMIGEGSTVAKAIWDKYVDFDFTKRMAEGAAGEAAPQGDLLAALRAERELCCKDVCACCQWPETWQEAALMPNGDGNPDSSPEYVHTFRPQIGSGTSRPIFKRCEANAIRSRVPEQAQAKTTSAESGFASTAGPRPNSTEGLQDHASNSRIHHEGRMIQDVDKWIAELKAAGWKRHATISTIWISPCGAWYRGPHKAWQNIGGAHQHDETTFNEIDNKLEQILYRSTGKTFQQIADDLNQNKTVAEFSRDINAHAALGKVLGPIPEHKHDGIPRHITRSGEGVWDKNCPACLAALNREAQSHETK